jgi:hypothetical protein
MFNGMIARLFAGSFDLSTVTQDFKKKTNPESLLGYFHKILGDERMKNIVNQNEIFFGNKSTIGSFILLKILESFKLSKLFKMNLINDKQEVKVNEH